MAQILIHLDPRSVDRVKCILVWISLRSYLRGKPLKGIGKSMRKRIQFLYLTNDENRLLLIH
jgi:hypothetical protein